jgi:hypothetical protein
MFRQAEYVEVLGRVSGGKMLLHFEIIHVHGGFLNSMLVISSGEYTMNYFTLYNSCFQNCQLLVPKSRPLILLWADLSIKILDF